MITKSDLQAVLDQMRTEDRKTRVEPPTVDEMLAYRAGELSGDEDARVRELLICWPELLRALMTPYPDDDAETLPPEVVERQWTAMRSQIGASRGGRVLTFRNALTAIAATLAVVFGGLLWQAKMELRRPRALPQQTLMSDVQRGGSDSVTTLDSHGDAYLLAPIINDERTFERYHFEIVDTDDTQRLLASGDVAGGEPIGVMVPHASLPPGRYKLILYGVNGERKEQLETYTVQVLRR
jgi:hypothetical protein